jgi:hypothetical protein
MVSTTYVLVFLVVSFPSGFPTNNLYAFLCSPIRATCLAHLTLLDLISNYTWRLWWLWWLWRLPSSGMLRRMAVVRTDVSEELSASVIRVARIGELGTTLAVNFNRSTLRRNTRTTRSNIPEDGIFQRSLCFTVACHGSLIAVVEQTY